MKNSGHTPSAFTLVELFASLSVLSVIMILFSQIVGLVWDAWRGGKSRIDHFAQARTALGLVDRDIQSMLLRSDVAAFVDGEGKPACAFYTRYPGSESGGKRRVSLVQYLLAPDASGKPRLARNDFALDYGDATPRRGITFNEPDRLPDLANPANLTQLDVGEGVIAFQFQFVDGNGTPGERFQFDRRHPTAASNTPAITLSLAVIDSDSYRTVEAAGKLPAMLAGFSGTPAPGQTYANYWRAGLPDLLATLPTVSRTSFRVFARSISIPVEAVEE